MTVANGPVLFNATDGSDLAASGLGPAAAVTGAGASTTSSSAVVTGIDTTGVSSGDLLWVLSSSGRQFSIIATVDSSTQVTCDDVFANTESGRTWAIGGKRATLDDTSSRQAFSDLAGISFKTETDQTLTSTLNMGGSLNQIEGASTTQRSVITQTASASILSAPNPSRLFNLKLQGGGSYAWDSGGSGTLKEAVNVVFGDSVNTIGLAVALYGAFRFHDCVIQYCTGNHNFQSVYSSVYMFNTKYINNAGYFIVTHGTGASYFINCLFANNGSLGLRGDIYNVKTYVIGCTFANNDGDGYYANYPPRFCYDNIFANNNGYGINITNASKDDEIAFVANNQFYGNTSGPTSGFDTGLSPLFKNPEFNNAAIGDFSTNQASSNILGDIESEDRLTRGYAGLLEIGSNRPNQAGTQHYPFRYLVEDFFEAHEDATVDGASNRNFHPLG